MCGAAVGRAFTEWWDDLDLIIRAAAGAGRRKGSAGQAKGQNPHPASTTPRMLKHEAQSLAARSWQNMKRSEFAFLFLLAEQSQMTIYPS